MDCGADPANLVARFEAACAERDSYLDKLSDKPRDMAKALHLQRLQRQVKASREALPPLRLIN